jgi:hypothetical protein
LPSFPVYDLCFRPEIASLHSPSPSSSMIHLFSNIDSHYYSLNLAIRPQSPRTMAFPTTEPRRDNGEGPSGLQPFHMARKSPPVSIDDSTSDDSLEQAITGVGRQVRVIRAPSIPAARRSMILAPLYNHPQFSGEAIDRPPTPDTTPPGTWTAAGFHEDSLNVLDEVTQVMDKLALDQNEHPRTTPTVRSGTEIEQPADVADTPTDGEDYVFISTQDQSQFYPRSNVQRKRGHCSLSFNSLVE